MMNLRSTGRGQIGYNLTIELEDQSRTPLFGKVSAPVPILHRTEQGVVWEALFQRDLTDRGVVAARIGRIIGEPIPEAWRATAVDVSNVDSILSEAPPGWRDIKPDWTWRKCAEAGGFMVTPHRGIPIESWLQNGKSLDDIANLDMVLGNIVFNVWIGNFDKKDGDYVVDSDNRVWSIDYNLSGPGSRSDPQACLGIFGRMHQASTQNLRWCIGPRFQEIFATYPIDHRHSLIEEALKRINSVTQDDIKAALKDLHLYQEDEDPFKPRREITSDMPGFLLERKRLVEPMLEMWVRAL